MMSTAGKAILRARRFPLHHCPFQRAMILPSIILQHFFHTNSSEQNSTYFRSEEVKESNNHPLAFFQRDE